MGMKKFKKYFKKYSRRKSFKNFARKVRSVITRSNETKYSANYLPSVFPTISSTWSESNFTALAQGDDVFSQRQGRRIAVTGFYLIGTLQGGQSNLATDDRINTVRMVGWVADNSTPMATAGHPISDLIGKRNNAGLIYKWCDRYFNLMSPGRDSTGYMPAIRHIKIYHKFKKPVIIDYSSTTGASWNKAIGMSMISDSTLAPSPGFTVGQIRMMYKDI